MREKKATWRLWVDDCGVQFILDIWNYNIYALGKQKEHSKKTNKKLKFLGQNS